MESSWGLALWETMRGLWRMCSLSSSESPGLKESWEKLRLITIKKSPGYWRKCSPVVERDASISEMPVPWHDHGEEKQWWRGGSGSLEDMLCVVHTAEVEEWPKPFGGARRSWMSPRRCTFRYLYRWGLILLCSDYNCALILPSWRK